MYIVQFTGGYITKACSCLGTKTVYPNIFSKNEVILHNHYKMWLYAGRLN